MRSKLIASFESEFWCVNLVMFLCGRFAVRVMESKTGHMASEREFNTRREAIESFMNEVNDIDLDQ